MLTYLPACHKQLVYLTYIPYHYLPICLPPCLSTHLPACQPTHRPSTCMPMLTYTCPSIHSSLHLFLHISVCFFFCLFCKIPSSHISGEKPGKKPPQFVHKKKSQQTLNQKPHLPQHQTVFSSIVPIATTLLIQTGVSENISHKKSCNILEPLDASSLQRKMADQDEFSNLEG